MKRFKAVSLIALLLVMTVRTQVVAATDPNTNTIGDANTAVLLLIIYVVLTLLFSFLCSVAESVLLSITPSYIEAENEKQPTHAALLKRLKQDNVDRSLAAILTLNTIAHTVGAIGAGAQATVIFGSAWFGLFSAVMTLMILFLSEILPKTIGAVYWSKLVGPTAFFVRSLIVILYPVVWISERLTKFISHGKNLHIFSRDELIAMTRVGEQTGQICANEAGMIRNLFRFRSMEVTDIMTPRPDIIALDIEADQQENWDRILASGHSQFPVYKNDPDNVLGIVSIKSLWPKLVAGQAINLSSLLVPPLCVPEGLNAPSLLEHFRQSRRHVALVVDEYGHIQGIVTLHDLLEATVGDLPCVEDQDIVQREDGSWLVDGLLPIEKFNEIVGIDIVPKEEGEHYHTVGGFMLLHFGCLPLSGAYFQWEQWRFEVVDMDGHRIDKVLVKALGKKDGKVTSREPC